MAPRSGAVLLSVAAFVLGALAPKQAGALPTWREAGLPELKTSIVYVLSPHPEDEVDVWSLIQRRAHQYTVFVTLTKGEQTTSCMTAEEASQPGLPEPAGPFKYQGPGSPVSQPDLGERHPFGNPWQGRGTQACKDARVASWHWFLDDMGRLDPSLPVEPPRIGRFCTGTAGCAEVWASGLGARVAFDLGDGNLTSPEVVAAVGALRANRAAWEIPVLPEAGVLTGYYNETPYSDWEELNRPSGGVAAFATVNCSVYEHPDQKAISDVVQTHDFGAGPQLGSTAACDDEVELVASVDPLSLAGAYLIDVHKYVLTLGDDERRYGAYVVNYGWQFPTWNVNPVNQAFRRASF